MKIQTGVTLYRCDHCNKRYQVKNACEKHERFCGKNPINHHACLTCEHLCKTVEEIEVDEYSNEWNTVISKQIKVTTFTCKALDKQLYSFRALAKNLVERFGIEGELMPLKCDSYYDKNEAALDELFK